MKIRRALLIACLLSGSLFAQISVIGTTSPTVTATFTPVSPLILNDSGGHHWAITIDDFGLLHSSSTSSTTSSIFQLDSTTDQSSWMLGVTTAGLLTTTRLTTFSPSLPSTFSFLTTHGHSTILWVRAGLLTTNTPQ